MFIRTERVSGWRDLQEKVRQLFAEMDYLAEVNKNVGLAGRGKKNIDGWVRDPTVKLQPHLFG